MVFAMLVHKAPAAVTTIPMWIATLVAFAFCGYSLRCAWWQGVRFVAIILAAALFGYGLEVVAIATSNDYHYGPFPGMLPGGVPAMIVVSWGGLVYGVMRTSDALGLKWYLRPIYDGMLALLIDLSLDPVSIALGFWVWTMPHKHWFGVPFANYIGWYSMVFGFSLAARTLFRLLDPGNRSVVWSILVPLIAIPVALVPFGLLMGLYLFLAGRMAEPLVFSAFLGTFALLILRYFPSLPRDAPLDYSALAAPIFFGSFEFLMLYASGLWQATSLYQEDADFVILVPLIAILSMICFAWPYLDDIGAKVRPAYKITE